MIWQSHSNYESPILRADFNKLGVRVACYRFHFRGEDDPPPSTFICAESLPVIQSGILLRIRFCDVERIGSCNTSRQELGFGIVACPNQRARDRTFHLGLSVCNISRWIEPLPRAISLNEISTRASPFPKS